jgi:hypothetical protein
MNKINFSCTTLAGTKKQGILRPDDNGYYTMPIGGLNVFNSAGEFYTYEGAKELFTSSSAFMRRVKSGCLKGETGHPKPLPGQSMESFAQRVMTIDEKNVCVHFSEIWLDFDNVKDANGKPIIAIMSKLTPSGTNGPALQKSLDNPKEEVCFSIRAFTEDRRVGGIKQRALREVVCFDNVTEPGISIAKKFFAPALESRLEAEFTKQDLIKSMTTEVPGLSMESIRNNGLELFQSLGWDFDKKDIPSWVNWK